MIFSLLCTAAFAAGYKTGFVRTSISLLLITAAVICSCYFFIPVADMVNCWPEAAVITIRIITFIILFLLTAALLFFAAALLPAGIYRNKSIMEKISGGLLASTITAASFTVTAILTGAPEPPKELTTVVNENGVSDQLESAVSGFTNLFAGTDDEVVTKILPAGNDSPVSSKNLSIGFTERNYTARPLLEKQMLELLNRERLIRGMRPLLNDSNLTAAARMHAADMLQRGYFSHNTPEGKTPFDRLHYAGILYRYAGENLAFGPSVLKAHEELMRSPGHKANILSKKYGRAGIAVLENSAHQLMIAQEFKD